jgi:hypothetical protein
MAQKQSALKSIGVAANEIYARKAFDAKGGVTGPWAGRSNIAPHKQPPSPKSEKHIPTPFFHWNNQNTICSYPILRPKNGAYEALLVCGKDLVYAPLVKFECGKGEIIFCQLEIEERTAVDPQADRLLIDIVSRFSCPVARQKAFAKIVNANDASKYGVKTEDAKVRTFEIAPCGEEIFKSLSKRDRFFRRLISVKTFSGEGVRPLLKPAFAAVKEVNGEKIVFLGIPQNALETELKLAEEAGVKSSLMWAAETQESRLNLIRSILERACGIEHDFPETGWKSKYNTETHIRW